MSQGLRLDPFVKEDTLHPVEQPLNPPPIGTFRLPPCPSRTLPPTGRPGRHACVRSPAAEAVITRCFSPRERRRFGAPAPVRDRSRNREDG